MPRKDSVVNASNAQAQQESVVQGVDAFELPKSLVTRLARAALSDNAKMQKDMLLAVMKGSTVFVNYLAANAHEVANSRQHKSVSASDVLRALEQMDMGDIVPKLQTELEIYRSNQKPDKGRKGGSRAKAKDTESVSGANASAKSRGKEKAAGPTITIPGRSVSAGAHAKARTEHELESETEDAPKRPGDDEDEEMLDAEQDGTDDDLDEEADDDAMDGDDDGEEIVDQMAIEEEELRRDARGVEERERVDDS